MAGDDAGAADFSANAVFATDNYQADILIGRYAQADSSVARRYGGTGLGLAICKRIVMQMGGEIGVLSRQGEGSTFAFQLTLPVGAQVPVERIDPASSAEDLKALLARLDRPFRLLVAEDNPTNQLVLRRMLAEFSLSLLMAGNGYEAIGGAQQFAPDMIFMDMRMPEMDGLEATKQIRQRLPKDRQPRIVALTAKTLGWPAVIEIAQMVRQAVPKAVIVCGGLGPTQDDITREAIAQVMGVELVRDDAVADVIRELFATRGRGTLINIGSILAVMPVPGAPRLKVVP